MEAARASITEMQDQMAVYSQTLRDMPSKASILAVLEDKLSAFKQEIETVLEEKLDIFKEEIETQTISQNAEMQAVGQATKGGRFCSV
jgi:hypothetical protein